MLLQTILALAIFAVARTNGHQVSNMASVQKFMDDIKAGIKIDLSNPPYYDSDHQRESTCFNWLSACSKTSFYNRHYLKHIESVEIRYNSHLDNIEDNLGTTPTLVKLLTSTTESIALTSGWKIGGKISLTGTALVQPGIEIGADYSEADTSTHVEVNTVERHITCEPGNTCRLDTWTFYAVIKGNCSLAKYFTCGKETRDVCMSAGWLGCDQYVDYYIRSCVDDTADPNHSCEVSFPIKDGSGKPVSRVVRTDTRLDARKRRRAVNGTDESWSWSRSRSWLRSRSTSTS